MVYPLAPRIEIVCLLYYLLLCVCAICHHILYIFIDFLAMHGVLMTEAMVCTGHAQYSHSKC